MLQREFVKRSPIDNHQQFEKMVRLCWLKHNITILEYIYYVFFYVYCKI